MKIIQILGLLLVLSSETFIDPAYPPNAVTGGAVIMELHSVAGKVEKVTVHSGEEPFVAAAKSALSQWRLHPDRKGADLVIVYFRQPGLYYLNEAGEKINGRPAGNLPYPSYLLGPAYPPQGLGQGSVVLKLEISPEGKVARVQTERSSGSLGEASVDAIRKWEFQPALNDQGKAITSSVYAVMVFRSPVIEQKK